MHNSSLDPVGRLRSGAEQERLITLSIASQFNCDIQRASKAEQERLITLSIASQFNCDIQQASKAEQERFNHFVYCVAI